MVKTYTFNHNGNVVTVYSYFSELTVRVSELVKALGMDGKSARDMIRSGIPKDSIMTVPLTKKKSMYFLKREGIIAFIKKYKEGDLLSFMEKFDALQKEKEPAVAEMRAKKEVNPNDPYAVDLLEDILRKIEQTNNRNERMMDALLSSVTRIMVMLLEMEVLYSRTAALLLRAESLGPIARINKELTKDLVSLGKEALSDAIACDQSLQEYANVEEKLDKEEEQNQKNDLLIKVNSKGGK